MEGIRVLHILHSMNRGGTENAIMNYYRHIDRNKIQFDFLLTEDDKCQFEDEILKLGGRVFRVPLLTLYNPFPYFKGVSRFYKEHPEYKIVHSHTSSKSFFPLFFAKRASVPIRICHSHNTRSEDNYKGVIRDILKYPLKWVATHYMACTEEAARWLYGERVIKKVIIVPNLIDTTFYLYDVDERYYLRNHYSIPETSFVIGCTARFSAQKNHDFLLSLFSIVHARLPNSFLLLIGDGERHGIIQQKIEELSLNGSVIMTGVVPDPWRYYSAMDVFVLPSLFEGLGMVFVEAQVSGLRCFASDGVPREADKTGLVSFLPLENGPKFWADAVAESIRYERESHIDDIRKAGYDAQSSAYRLEEFYIEAYKQAMK